MMEYFALRCEDCGASALSLRKGIIVGPAEGAQNGIWAFLFAHAGHTLRNVSAGELEDSPEIREKSYIAARLWLDRKEWKV
jgi:hypothetical protein